MTDYPDIYRRFLAYGTAPALTWYSPDGRVELSGKVVATHLAKISSYLTDEVWLNPGDELLLDVPAAYKQVLWGLGSLVAGLKVTIDDETSPAHPDSPRAVLTNRPKKWLSDSPCDHSLCEHSLCEPGNSDWFMSPPDSKISLPRSFSSAQSLAQGKEIGRAQAAPHEQAEHQQTRTRVCACQLNDSSTSFHPEEVLALDLAPLVFSWMGDVLPGGVRDATAEVMGSPDVLLNEYDLGQSNIQQWIAGCRRKDRDEEKIRLCDSPREALSSPGESHTPHGDQCSSLLAGHNNRGKDRQEQGQDTHAKKEESAKQEAPRTAARALLLVAPTASEVLVSAVQAQCRIIVVENTAQVEAVKEAERVSLMEY